MPATLYYSHKVLEKMAADRHAGVVDFLEPDAKSQVTLQYEGGKPVRAHALVVSTQHSAALSNSAGQDRLRDYVIGVFTEILPEGWLPEDKAIYVNPTGLFEIGGPDGDCGLTGRKIIVDTYGGAAPHGGGAFSGKDPTKVDRSAAYISRYMAKNIVAAGLARRCTIQLSYAIGIAEPLSLYVDTHGTGKVDDARIEVALPRLVSLTPKGIRTHLGLNKPIYQKTASYGHFGREPESDHFSWERTDLVDDLRSIFSV
jgi:S-adenosylmethionine synthetase